MHVSTFIYTKHVVHMYIRIDVNQPVSSQLHTSAAEEVHNAPRNPKKNLFVSSFLSSCMKMKDVDTLRPLWSRVYNFLFFEKCLGWKNCRCGGLLRAFIKTVFLETLLSVLGSALGLIWEVFSTATTVTVYFVFS